MTDQSNLWRGVDTLLNDYAGVVGGDSVVVAYTPECREVAGRVVVALKTRGDVDVKSLVMGAVKDDTFAERLECVLPDPDILTGRLICMLIELSSISHTNIVPRLLNRYPLKQARQVRVINGVPELLTHSLNVTPNELSGLNSSVLHRLLGKHELHMTSRSGTDLRASVDSSRALWISNRGVADDGYTVIVPSGEVATLPTTMSGVLVADGAFSANVPIDSDTRLSDAPASITIVDNEVTDFECANPRIMNLLGQLFAVPFARCVGELGFGTNVGTPAFVAMNSFINERFPGVHIGFGAHNQGGLKPGRDISLHIDFMSPYATVQIDDQPELLDFSSLRPTCRPHPRGAGIIDEDAESDCCGIRLVDQQAAAVSTVGLTPRA